MISKRSSKKRGEEKRREMSAANMREEKRVADQRRMEEGSGAATDAMTPSEEYGVSDPDFGCCITPSVLFLQKIMAEVFGTYFAMFAGHASIIVNIKSKGTVTLPGIAFVWGLVFMVMIYCLGHISGAHLNPAVSIAFASCKRFPWKQVPAYAAAQILGSILALGTLHLLYGGGHELFAGSVPSGSNIQALVLEFIITFYLMFVISGVATDNRAIGELAGIAIGSTVLLNVLIAGPISGCSMNPARSLGPAIIANRYQSIWVYIVGPIAGAVAGAWAYNLIRFTNKPLREITSSASFLKSFNKNSSG